MTYKQSLNYQNVQLGDFETEGMLDIPVIKPLKDFDEADVSFLGFNYAMSEKSPSDKTLHFYLDDYQFERVWNTPSRYLDIVSRFKYVLSPDFSLFTDFPIALNMYNHYRKHWVAAYWQSHGIKVIPTICWSNRETFAWCFDGEPKGSVVSVSSIGANYSKASREAFIEGYEAMEGTIYPSKVLFYGKPFEELKNRDNIVYVQNEQIARLRNIKIVKA